MHTSLATYESTVSLCGLLHKNVCVSQDRPVREQSVTRVSQDRPVTYLIFPHLCVLTHQGFLLYRILMPMINEAFFCMMESVGTPEDIDRGMRLGTNMALGPLKLADSIGGLIIPQGGTEVGEMALWHALSHVDMCVCAGHACVQRMHVFTRAPLTFLYRPGHVSQHSTHFPYLVCTPATVTGLDTCLSIMKVLQTQFGDSKYRACPLLKELVAAGRLGRKTGHGVYSY